MAVMTATICIRIIRPGNNSFWESNSDLGGFRFENFDCGLKQQKRICFLRDYDQYNQNESCPNSQTPTFIIATKGRTYTGEEEEASTTYPSAASVSQSYPWSGLPFTALYDIL
jgi:hypothetical protein